MSNYIFLIGTIAVIHLLACISPGPDFLLAVKNSITYSRKTGSWTAVGFGLGMAVHISYCLAGLALIISQSILIFNALKLLGAAYLLYLGMQSLLAKGHRGHRLDLDCPEKNNDISPLKAVSMGFLTNVLNPKATLFMLGLFTVVILPGTPAVVLALASLIIVADTVFWFILVAHLFTRRRIRAVYQRTQALSHRFFGGLLIILGLKIAFAKK